jgi:glycosyltransferase involved in cell wall biosynthesis
MATSAAPWAKRELVSASLRPSGDGRRPLTILYHHRTKSLDGQRVHICAIQDALRENGHHVFEVSVLKSTEVAGAVPSKGWRRILFDRLQTSVPASARDVLEYLYNPVGCAALMREGLRHKPDFIYERYAANTVAGVWAARLLGVPLLLEVNSPLATEQHELASSRSARAARAIERYVLSHATRVLAVSQVLARMIVQDARLEPGTVKVIHNGVDFQSFQTVDAQRTAIREQLDARERVVVGAAAFFRTWHGVDQLLRVVARNSELRSKVLVVLIGDGPALPDLQRLVSEHALADSVRCTGAIPHDAVPAFLSAIDVAVLPRATAYASPLKLFEYMAAGKAIIAPRQENVLEVATEGRDMLCFTPDHDGELEQRLCYLVASATVRQQLGDAARARVAHDNRTWQGNAHRIVAAFEELAAVRSPDPRAEAVGSRART